MCFLCPNIFLHKLLSRFHTSFNLGYTVYSHYKGKPVKNATSAPQPGTGDLERIIGSDYFSCPKFLIITPSRDYKRLHVGVKETYMQGYNTCIEGMLVENCNTPPWLYLSVPPHGPQCKKHRWMNKWVTEWNHDKTSKLDGRMSTQKNKQTNKCK